MRNFALSYNLILIQWRNKILVIDWSVYLEFSVLESIKVLIYNSDNNYKSKKYRKDSQVLVTDTNRLFYEITRACIAKDVLGKKRNMKKRKGFKIYLINKWHTK